MIVPPYLKAGDPIAIIASARKVSKEELAPARAMLESYGLRVVYGPHLFEADHQLAGSDAQRAADLQWAVSDPEIKAVLFARGGYGTVRIIDLVDLSPLLKHPKWFAGYSDITLLHSELNTLGIASLHSTMAFSFDKHEEATHSLKQLLFGEPLSYRFEPHALNRTGTGSAELVGGNLSILYAMAGTHSDLNTEGKILFLEDLDEYLYHIDRMMMQLKRSGKLSGLKGLVVGGMSDMKDNAIPFGKTAEEIIREAVNGYDYPVCFNFPAGHIPRNLALYLGRRVSIDVSANNSQLHYL